MQQLFLLTAALLFLLPYTVTQTLAQLLGILSASVSLLILYIRVPDWAYAVAYRGLCLTGSGHLCFLVAFTIFLWHGSLFMTSVVVLCWLQAAFTSDVVKEAYEQWCDSFVWYNPNPPRKMQKLIKHEEGMDFKDRDYDLLHFRDLPRKP